MTVSDTGYFWTDYGRRRVDPLAAAYHGDARFVANNGVSPSYRSSRAYHGSERNNLIPYMYKHRIDPRARIMALPRKTCYN